MGLLLSRPPEEYAPSVTGFRTPFTDMTGQMGHQLTGPCVPLNLRWVDCLEAYGAVKGRSKCSELFQDYAECVRRWKQLHRVEDMKNERDRQWFMGLMGRGPPVPIKVKDVPAYDVFLPDVDVVDP